MIKDYEVDFAEHELELTYVLPKRNLVKENLDTPPVKVRNDRTNDKESYQVIATSTIILILILIRLGGGDIRSNVHISVLKLGFISYTNQRRWRLEEEVSTAAVTEKLSTAAVTEELSTAAVTEELSTEEFLSYVDVVVRERPVKTKFCS
ncbi:hypothetical protein HID58_084589 [Brassica napus]|uniref:Uncharacterized protein n=1 Tax=Brassica napus TaxID=3708 RepID=A0ABQ7XK44_BRANA|nr:hypothetical protein HID58_084589 [Brassica napus]